MRRPALDRVPPHNFVEAPVRLAVWLALSACLPGSLAAKEPAGFTAIPSERSGVHFTNRLSPDRALANHILLNGSGVALGDVDGDGRVDLFLPALEGGSGLFRNLGEWRFTNVTATAFAPRAFEGMDATGAVLADLDGDRRPDLLVNGVRTGTRCFLNRGEFRFEETTAQSGLAGPGGPTSFALADIDADGDLDLYVVRYRSTTVRDEFQQRFGIRVVDGKPVLESVNGRPVTDPELVGRFTVDAQGRVTENGEADGLYRNDGKGRFELVSFTGGAFRDEAGRPLTAPPYDWGLAAMFRDIDGDGDPDLYVCNDLNSPDRIWLNDGRGGFQAIPRTAIRKTSWFSMGIDFGDLDRDGHDDFLVTDMLQRDPVRRQADAPTLVPPPEAFGGSEARPQVPRTTLHRGRGDGTFAEVAWHAGLAATDWSWSPVFLDVDLDGYEDVLITTGFERDVQDADVAEAIEAIRQREKLSDAAALALRRRFPSLAQANLAFRNLGGLRFAETGREWGFDLHGISQGIALGDLDNDGDLDVVLNNQNAAATLLRNDATAPRIWVRPRGRGANADAVGARIVVEGGAVRQQQSVTAGGRFLSGDAPGRTFAVGAETNRLTVTVNWPGGGTTRIADVRSGARLEPEEPAETSRAVADGKPRGTLFEDVSARLGHRHVDEPFDDEGLQPLLSRSLARTGPALAWADLNADGLEDLVVGTGKGGRVAGFLNDGKGGFSPAVGPAFSAVSPMDQAGVLVRARAGATPEILAAISNYETPAQPGMVRVLDLAAEGARPGGIRMPMAAGPMAMADVDGDGFLDLFVGGRVVGGRYPEPTSSALLRGREGGWAADPGGMKALQGVGMVVGAVFSDLDDDGDPDLVLATEWGAVRLFGNEQGRLVERRSVPLRWAEADPRPRPAMLETLTGWWTGVVPVDVDEDGLMDLVVGNWGRNSRHRAEPERPVVAYTADLTGTGVPVFLETFSAGAPARELPWVFRDRLALVWPSVLERFQSRAAFGAADVRGVLGDQAASAKRWVATTLDTMVLRNRGDHWVAQPLPEEAQMAPVFGIGAADFDGDGHEDLFLGQNHFGSVSDGDRQDAGFGLVLLGDGKGGWRPMASRESGVLVPGEQRGVAVADFDGDGRVDVAVGQNGEATRLLRNRGGVPGLRVRFKGEAGNPSGVGLRVRGVDASGRAGGVREVRAGGGYWSQDSAVLVLAGVEGGELEVRWPGKAVVRHRIPRGAGQLTVGIVGGLEAR